MVDLRGRAERGARSKSSSSKSGASKVDDSVVGPPPLLNPEQVSALGAAKGDQIQGQPQASSSPDQAASAAAGGDGEPSAGGMQAAADPQLDFAVTRLKRQGSAASMSEGSMSEEEGGSNGNGGVRRRGDTEEMAAALVSVRALHVEMNMEQAGGGVCVHGVGRWLLRLVGLVSPVLHNPLLHYCQTHHTASRSKGPCHMACTLVSPALRHSVPLTASCMLLSMPAGVAG